MTLEDLRAENLVTLALERPTTGYAVPLRRQRWREAQEHAKHRLRILDAAIAERDELRKRLTMADETKTTPCPVLTAQARGEDITRAALACDRRDEWQLCSEGPPAHHGPWLVAVCVGGYWEADQAIYDDILDRWYIVGKLGAMDPQPTHYRSMPAWPVTTGAEQ